MSVIFVCEKFIAQSEDLSLKQVSLPS